MRKNIIIRTKSSTNKWRSISISLKYRCPDTNKIQFASEKQAKLFMEFLNKKSTTKRKITGVYKCTRCIGWHMTSLCISRLKNALKWNARFCNPVRVIRVTPRIKHISHHVPKATITDTSGALCNSFSCVSSPFLYSN